MTATLPLDVQQVFARFVTTELTTIDRHGQPITWPVAPYYHEGAECIDVSTAVGFPKKARDAERNPKVSLLFSDATGSDLNRAPMVLVQGSVTVDDEDLDRNRERYVRESVAKLSKSGSPPPDAVQRRFAWYFTRIYMHIRPERVYVWADGNPAREPELLDSHMEEVRSGHDEEPDVTHDPPQGGRGHWEPRMAELGKRYPTAVLSLVAPDGFPFSARVPVRADRGGRVIRIDPDVTGMPLQPGLACVTAHEHDAAMRWHRSFQVRGDLIERRDGWMLVPHRLVDGFELPRAGSLTRTVANFAKIRRFRKTAKREMARRGAR